MQRLQTLLDTESGGCFPYVVGGVGVLVTGVVLHKIFRRKRATTVEAPTNTAVIYQFQRGPRAPSMSPFPVKLETFCRVANIPYVAAAKMPANSPSKNKIPWMSYNGDIVEDSQFCIDYLTKKVGVDINKHLDVPQKAVSRFIQVLVDEHLYWTMVYFRWIHDNKFFPQTVRSHMGMPWFVYAAIKRTIRGQLYGQGIGRHTPEQIRKIMVDDLRALSDMLGSKPYMLGDSMCVGDCSAFGMLSQFVWHQEDPVLGNILRDEFPNLHDYCFRIKDNFWPDWNKSCKKID